MAGSSRDVAQNTRALTDYYYWKLASRVQQLAIYLMDEPCLKFLGSEESEKSNNERMALSSLYLFNSGHELRTPDAII
jgi:hypothetical protein